MKDHSEMSEYEKETLAALYKTLDYMQCNDLPTFETEKAIINIESKRTK